MANIKNLLLMGAAAIAGLTGCQTYHNRAGGERSEGRMVDDRRITAVVRSELRHEPVYKFTDVDVRTFNGVVQLSGFVNSEDQKRRAAEIAQSVDGVNQVQNAISMKPEVPSPTGRAGNNSSSYSGSYTPSYSSTNAPAYRGTNAPSYQQ